MTFGQPNNYYLWYFWWTRKYDYIMSFANDPFYYPDNCQQHDLLQLLIVHNLQFHILGSCFNFVQFYPIHFRENGVSSEPNPHTVFHFFNKSDCDSPATVSLTTAPPGVRRRNRNRQYCTSSVWRWRRVNWTLTVSSLGFWKVSGFCTVSPVSQTLCSLKPMWHSICSYRVWSRKRRKYVAGLTLVSRVVSPLSLG